MGSLFCGRSDARRQDAGLMPGEENFSNNFWEEGKQLIVNRPRRRLRKSKGLTAKMWRRSFDAEGQFTNVAKLLGKVW